MSKFNPYNYNYRKIFLLSFFFYLFWLNYTHYRSYNKYIKFFKTDLTNMKSIVRNSNLILNEFKSLIDIQIPISGKIYIIPEKIDPNVGNMDLLIQYSFTDYDYKIVESLLYIENNSSEPFRYIIKYRKLSIKSDLNLKLLNESLNYQFFKILP